MMTLPEKILALYPELTAEDFIDGYIRLQNDSDGRGDYIAEWNHPDFPRPTDEELAAFDAPVEQVTEESIAPVETKNVA